MPTDFNPGTTVAIALRGTDNRAGEHRPVHAEVVGQWAVHHSQGASYDTCTVTHIPTGSAVSTGLKLESARWLAEQLHAHVPAFEKTEGTQWIAARPIIKRLRDQCP